MAAPPKVTANKMKQAQADKLAAYTQKLREKGKPHVDRFVTRMDGALQVAFENERPVSEVSQLFSVPPNADLGIEELDRTAWIEEWKNVVTSTYRAGGRNFNVAITGDETLLRIALSWT